MVGASAISSQILLVGDTGTRLEGELAMHGLACAKAATANDAVARMRATRFPFVVVSPNLADMGGVDFIHGVLRHFDASVVLYGNGIDVSEISALLRTGRVAHFAGSVEGQTVADFLAQRAGPVTTVPHPAASLLTRPPQINRGAETSGSFNLTPGSSPSAPSASQLMTPPAVLGASLPPLALNELLDSSFALPSAVPGWESVGSANAIPPDNRPGFAGAGIPGPGLPTSLPPFASLFSSTPRPVTPSPGPGAEQRAAQQQTQQAQQAQQGLQVRFEAMADELARASAELVSLRGRVGALDRENATLLSEVDIVRRKAMADVAQVMALSEEGAAVDTELEDTKEALQRATTAQQRAQEDLEAARQENARLTAEVAGTAARIAGVSAGRDVAEARLAELTARTQRDHDDANMARAELEIFREQARSEQESTANAYHAANQELTSLQAQAALERESSRAALLAEQEASAGLEAIIVLERNGRSEAESKLTKYRIESDERWTALLAEESERATAAEERNELLAHQRNDLAHALAQALSDAEAKTGNSDVEAALRVESEQLRADVAGARTDATTVRLDLQEAVMRLEEANTSLVAVRLERDALLLEAAPLREWGNALVAAHAHQQGELERLRPLLEGQLAKDAAREATIAQLNAKLDAMSARPAGTDGDMWLSRFRQLADLFRALEPFLWGLTQAAAFYKEQGTPGGEAHLRSLLQLQGVLLRLRDDIAKLDLA